MRKAEFAVPSGAMAEFADKLAEQDLENSITGTNDDDAVIVEVSYNKDESDTIDELEEFLDELKKRLADEEEEEDEEEEDEE